VGKEKRRGPRGPVSATAVLLRGEQHLGSFRVLNLSAGGALLVGRPPDAPASAPEDFEVLVRLSTGRTVRAHATIVREDSIDEASVFALAFGKIAQDDNDAIHNVVLTALEDARDATALIVAGAPEAWHLLRRELSGLGHPSFVVSTREDALRFVDAPNLLTVALVDLALHAKDVDDVLTTLAAKHPHIRRIVMATPAKSPRHAAVPPATPPLAHDVLANPWTRDSLGRVLAR
jgi:CheY-like chemotaxis protein